MLAFFCEAETVREERLLEFNPSFRTHWGSEHGTSSGLTLAVYGPTMMRWNRYHYFPVSQSIDDPRRFKPLQASQI